MSARPSLRHRPFASVVVNGSHPGQVRRSARKRELRQLKQEEDTREAARLKITIDELLRRRFHLTQQILAGESARQERMLREAEEQRRRWGRQFYY